MRGANENAEQLRNDFLELNPDMIFLVEIRMKDYPPSTFPSDSPYWVRDEQGNLEVSAGGWYRTGGAVLEGALAKAYHTR